MEDGRYALIEIKTGMNRISEAEKSLLKFCNTIKKYNETAQTNTSHPKPIYRYPDALIVICANADIAYTTENGIKVIPIGCLRD